MYKDITNFIKERNNVERIGFSIIIPCYNASKTISRCLKSIESNNYSNCEIILINDKSSDNTIDAIENYVLSSDMKIKVLDNNENLGAGASRNVGIENASKEFMVFIDADDTISSDFFNTIASAFDQYDCDCVIFDAVRVSGINIRLKMFYNPKIKEGIVNKKEALVYTRGATCGKVYKTSVIKNNNIKYATLKRNEDLVFTKIAISYCNCIYYLSKEIYHYINVDFSLMNNMALLDKNNAIKAYGIIEKALWNKNFEDELNSIYFLEVVYSTTLTTIRQNKDNKLCRKYFKTCLKDYGYDKYYKGYNLKIKIVSVLIRFNMYSLIRRIL